MSEPTPLQLREWYEAALPGDRRMADALARHLAGVELRTVRDHLNAVARELVGQARANAAGVLFAETVRDLLHRIASDVDQRRREVTDGAAEEKASGIIARALAKAAGR